MSIGIVMNITRMLQRRQYLPNCTPQSISLPTFPGTVPMAFSGTAVDFFRTRTARKRRTLRSFCFSRIFRGVRVFSVQKRLLSSFLETTINCPEATGPELMLIYFRPDQLISFYDPTDQPAISTRALNPKAYDRQPKPVIFPLHTAEIIETCLNSSRA